jgi:hypothetical protein
MKTLQTRLDEEFSKVETLFEKQSARASERKGRFEAFRSMIPMSHVSGKENFQEFSRSEGRLLGSIDRWN